MAAPWANALLKLQNVDLRIRDLKTRLTLLPKERQRIADRKNALDRRPDAVRAAVKQDEMAVRKAESEIAALEDSIRKTQQQSALVKKNVEYQAMLAGIDMSRKRIGDLESAVLEAYERIETAQAEIRRITAENQAEIRSLKAEWKEFDQLEADIRAELEKVRASRAAFASGLPASLVESYGELLKHNDGAPLAPIQDNICGNCCLKLTPQTLTTARNGAVAYCDNCCHLVYFEEV